MKNDIAINVEEIGKCYRIGMKDKMSDNFASTVMNILKSPLNNYRKYRSLYKFDEITDPNDTSRDNNYSDIIWAVRDVSFNVKRGEVVGIIGRNGAGKSTLLKILSRITTPTKGCVEIYGKVSSLLEVGTGFHPELTGRENIYLNGTILGMRKKEVEEKFDEIVEFSGISKFLDTPIKRYSSGMKVRLAFSVAAYLEPEILIIDEVLAVGDADFQKKCLDKMQEVGEKGKTVLFVSHNMPAVTRLCERTILLDGGRVIDDGPSDRIVGEYLGASHGTKAVCEWAGEDKAPAGSVARLRAVRMLNEDGEVSESFDIRHPIIMEMEFDVLKPGYVLLPHFGLRNEKGESVFITVDVDQEWRKKPRPKGRYKSTALIYGNLLSEGRLFVNCNLMTLSPNELQFSERNVVAFQVIDRFGDDTARGDCTGVMGGVVRPLLKWETKFISN